MSYARVQVQAGGAPWNGTHAVALFVVSATTSGNLILVWAVHSDPANAPIVITDSAGNTYHALPAIDGATTAPGLGVAQLFYAYNITGMADHEVYGDWPAWGAGFDSKWIEIYEISGAIGTHNPFIEAVGAHGGVSADPYDLSIGTVTPSAVGDLIVTFLNRDVFAFIDTHPPGDVLFEYASAWATTATSTPMPSGLERAGQHGNG